MAGKTTIQNSRGFGEIKAYVTPAVKAKIIERAKERGISISDLCSPVLVALANGEIYSKVIDARVLHSQNKK